MRYFGLLIATSLLYTGVPALAAGWGPATEEQATAAVLRLGGRVEVEEESFAQPVVGVWLGETAVGDEDLALLEGLPDLERLELRSTRVTDAGLARLKKFSRLRSLNLQSVSGVTDHGLEQLIALTHLERLDLQGTRVTSEGLRLLAGLPNLRSVYLSGDRTTNESLARLGEVRGIEELVLAYTKVTDEGLAHLAKLPNLRRLHLRSGRITDAGLAHLRLLTRLEVLQIPSTPHVTDAAIADLRRARPNLRISTFREGDDPR